LKPKNKYDKFKPHWKFGFRVLWLQQLLWLSDFGLPQALLHGCLLVSGHM